MKVHKWSDIKKRFFTPARIAELEREARTELLKMDLKALRKFAGKTQAELAKKANISQAELSRAEAREDHRLSTLNRFVRALGGELEVIAHIGDTSIRLVSVRPQARSSSESDLDGLAKKAPRAKQPAKPATGSLVKAKKPRLSRQPA